VLETNDDTISLQDAASGYKGLLVIERCFRSLKRTQIKMTPMFHWLPHRIEAHVRICVLALLIERVAELACAQSWFRNPCGRSSNPSQSRYPSGFSPLLRTPANPPARRHTPNFLISLEPTSDAALRQVVFLPPENPSGAQECYSKV
jgi:hypothetical protein